MEQIKYEVVFMADYPDGQRHPVKVVTTATNATNAISIAADALEDDRILSTNHVLISVAPSALAQLAEGDERCVLKKRHQQAQQWLTDAYLFHLVSIHRRPVYRHQYGDIHLDQPSVSGFLDSHLEEKGWDLERRWRWFHRCLDLEAYMHRKNSSFIDWGTVPQLKPRGIRWINACFNRLGEMVEDLGGWENVERTVGVGK